MTNILMIEDDETMVALYQRALRMAGYDVSIAENGLDGLKKIEENAPDLILLDIMMPEMNGIEFLEEIKKKKETQNIPVILLTNLAGDTDAEHGLSKGADKYIIKSQQDPNKVVEAIKELLAEYEQGKKAPVAKPLAA